MNNRQNWTSPRGTAVWPHLHAPDTKFNPEGVYTTKVRFEGDSAAEVRELLDGLLEDAGQLAIQAIMDSGKAKTVQAAQKIRDNKNRLEPYVEELDEETGEETGAIIVNFKMKASGTSQKTGKKWTRQPTIFDANAQPVKPGLRIGGGSILRIATELDPFWSPGLGYGVSIRLNAVQVIELQTFGEQNDPSALGFESEAGGFSAESAGSTLFAGDENADDEADGMDEEEGDDDDGDF